MTRFITACFALAFAFGLAACNTVEGAGKDISKAGDKIEDAAKKNK
jgi:predicted small secreted protein